MLCYAVCSLAGWLESLSVLLLLLLLLVSVAAGVVQQHLPHVRFLCML